MATFQGKRYKDPTKKKSEGEISYQEEEKRNKDTKQRKQKLCRESKEEREEVLLCLPLFLTFCSSTGLKFHLFSPFSSQAPLTTLFSFFFTAL